MPIPEEGTAAEMHNLHLPIILERGIQTAEATPPVAMATVGVILAAMVREAVDHDSQAFGNLLFTRLITVIPDKGHDELVDAEKSSEW